MSWRDSAVVVEGRRFTFRDMTDALAKPVETFFHASPHEIAVGTDLIPQGSKKNFTQSPNSAVCLSSDPRRAVYWARDASKHATHIWLYKVQPHGAIDLHRVGLSNYGKGFTAWEARVGKATILSVHKIDVTGNIVLPETI